MRIRIIPVIVCILCFTCLPFGSVFSQDTQITWQKQLECLKKNTDEKVKGDIAYLSLVDYTYMGEIVSEEDKFKLIDSIFSYDAATILYLPSLIESDTIEEEGYYEVVAKEYPMFKIIPIKEVVKVYESKGKENPIKHAKQELYKILEIGFEYLELKWNYKGDIFYSICIVSNKKGGIIYDSVSSQLTIGVSQVTILEK